MIKGLYLIEDVITESEEKELIKLINNLNWSNVLSRRVQQYGYTYNYKSSNVLNPSNPSDLPSWATEIANKLIKKCSKDILLKEIVSFLHELNNLVLIFGSASVNLKEANDIDLAVIGDLDKLHFKEFEKKYDIKFHLINLEKLEEITLSLKEEIKKKHLLIQNSEEIVKWMLKN